MTNKVTTILDFKKTTKNTFVYGEQDTSSAIGSLYIKRSTVPADPPKTITVEISFDDE